MSIRQDGQSYRRGVVFGFTVAEVVLLLVFCLLLLFMPMLLAEAEKHSSQFQHPAQGSPPISANSPPKSDAPAPPLGKPGSPSQQGKTEKAPLPEDWKELVPNGTGNDRAEGPNGPKEAQLRPPSAEPKPGLTLDGVCKKLGIPSDKCTVVNADTLLHNAGRHNWPPIIPLKEADGYYFVVGSAQPSAEFESKVRQSVVPEILKYASQYQTDVIEVVGHTDEQPILGGPGSNLDVATFDVLLGGGSAAKLTAADNAGLGFARSVAIVQILRTAPELKNMIILPLSAAQVVNTNGKLVDGARTGDIKERRRIEVRLRQSDPGLPK